MTKPASPMPSHCPNCQADVHGPYCAQCGQETVIERLTLRDFSHEYFQNFVTLEGRLWRSLWLLVSQPGQLTLEFLAGRRRRYVRPLPLYLSLSFLMFLLLAFSSPDNFVQLDPQMDLAAVPGTGSRATDGAADRTGQQATHGAADKAADRETGRATPVSSVPWRRPAPAPGEDAMDLDNMAAVVASMPAPLRPLGKRYVASAKRFHDDPKAASARLVQAVIGKLPYAVFLLVPAFALATRLLYRRRARLYTEHLLFALHLHAFVFLSLIAGYWLAADTSAPILVWGWVAYLTLALRRVFGGRWWVQTARAVFLLMGHSVLLALAVALTMLASLPSV